MTLLLDPALLAARRAAAGGPLAPLARSLAAGLEPLLVREPLVPAEKARMTRLGGRCPSDGAPLDFDPWSPREHRCPRCGAWYGDEEHYQWWIMSYHLWLAERAVHAAVLALLGGDERHARLADGILERYAERYLGWPNRDNVLGPTRPFFSTYLESIWLLQLCVALDLREAAGGAGALGATVRDRLVEPSRALVAGYDEGLSNRQTWNAVALLAAARLLGDAEAAERAVQGPSGVAAHLRHGLLADGSWYEGENYHLFAHRALWYGVSMAERAGIGLEPALIRRFADGFAAPFATALPDMTFPSRRDSQYGVSLRQWRFAELCELGLARGDDPRLTSALARLYADDLPAGDTGRDSSTADVERHVPPARLDRSSLGWKSLLFARAELPPLAPRAPASVLLESQGLAVVRRDAGRVYVALDYGHSGGGHGHPDRLNLLLVDGTTRWLDDYGTGSYVDPSLHWYRSTLAHGAPLVDGRSQARTHGALLAHEERGGAGWVDAEAVIAPGIVARRTVIVMPDYLLDELSWRAMREVDLDLPLHADGEWDVAAPWSAASLAGGDGLEDGFRFVREVESVPIGATVRRLDAVMGRARATAWLLAPRDALLWRALAPGAPGSGDRRFHAVRCRGAEGRVVTAWSWRGAVEGVARDGGGAVMVSMLDGTRHRHARAPHGWHVDLAAGGARSSIDLAGLRERPPAPPLAPEPLPPAPRTVPRVPGADQGALVITLGRDAYRRSEQSWEEAGSPTVRLALWVHDEQLRFEIRVRKTPFVFAPRRDSNPLDNEHPDTNSDGVQLHVAPSTGEGPWSWLAVPEEGGAVRVTATGDAPPLAARWREMGGGYLLELGIPIAPLGAGPFGLDLIVNEMPAGRERRRGQIVLSGARGEFVYLRGDRQPTDRLLPFVVGHG